MQFAVANSLKMHKDRFCEGKIITNRNLTMNKAQLVEKIATEIEETVEDMVDTIKAIASETTIPQINGSSS